jgi:predicted O-linked N-acetylglucosamine transferase (SPINDLY family)
VDALLNRASTLVTLKRPAEAVAAYARVLTVQPERAEAYNGRGHALFDLGRFEEALANYDKAVSLKPDLYDAHVNRARALAKLDRYKEASAVYEKLYAINSDIPNLFTDLIYCNMMACNWVNMEQLTAEAFSRVAAGTTAVDPFMFLGLPSTPEQQLACARNCLRQRSIVSVSREWNKADLASDRIRLVYLSSDYNRHATAHLIAELFEIHDRDRFEVVGISFGQDDGSPMRSRLIKSFDRFFDVKSRTDADVARLIRDLRAHIAIDLKGYTSDARVGIFAQRVAPVQVSYLGYPGTMGADFIDYVIADPISLPFEQQPFYPEKIVHLPDTYQVNDSKRRIGAKMPTRRAVGLPEHGFVFCCFNNNWKLNPAMFDVWMRVLHQVDGSVLWLLRSNDLAAENLRKEAQARGIDPDRLVFASSIDSAEHLARHQLADLFLDTLPYNAHTTASDSLWAGVPLVTCQGTTFAGRVAASLLHAVGLPELVTESLNDYEQLALKLAREPDLLRAIRSRLAAQRSSWPLFDSQRFRRHIEAAYQTMWDIWQRDESPRSFKVDPQAC